MQRDNTAVRALVQESVELSGQVRSALSAFADPLLAEMDRVLDKRLVGTFSNLLGVILAFRNRSCGLLLSELGGQLLGPAHAPAGTKRISNLLRSARWKADAISDFLYGLAEQRLQQLEQAEKPALLLWDESVVEKPESEKCDHLCAVRSSKARRLKRIRPGYFNPPGGRPIFVAGLEWMAQLLIGRGGPPTVVRMRWWSKRGPGATDLASVREEMLQESARTFARRVIHVFDRGYAGSPWIGQLLTRSLRFIMRWQKDYKLIGADGQTLKAWELMRGKPTQEWRYIPRANGDMMHVGILAMPVHHPDYEQPFWLLAARQGNGHSPMYLLTNEPIGDVEEAWRILQFYMRRWQIEMTFRYEKSELGLESPRLWTWERREKLMLIVTLVYAFLLSMLVAPLRELCQSVIDKGCHRTGKRSRQRSAPLYRLRAAISALFALCPGFLAAVPQTPG